MRSSRVSRSRPASGDAGALRGPATAWCGFATAAARRRSAPPRQRPGLQTGHVLQLYGLPALLGRGVRRDAATPDCLTVAAHGFGRSLEAVLQLDDRVDALALAGDFRLVVHGDEGAAEWASAQVALRCARWEGRRGAAAADPRFTASLRRHRRMHDLEPALVRADYRHSLDAWQWVLRLAPRAGAALQLAALFHDVERLAREADRRVEPAGEDEYERHKRRHAEAGARIAAAVLEEIGWDREQRERAAELVALHDHRGAGRDPERQLLEDADALSFFALNAAGYLAWHGPERSAEKSGWTRARLSARGRAVLDGLPLLPAVADLLRRSSRHLVAVPGGVAARRFTEVEPS